MRRLFERSRKKKHRENNTRASLLFRISHAHWHSAQCSSLLAAASCYNAAVAWQIQYNLPLAHRHTLHVLTNAFIYTFVVSSKRSFDRYTSTTSTGAAIHVLFIFISPPLCSLHSHPFCRRESRMLHKCVISVFRIKHKIHWRFLVRRLVWSGLVSPPMTVPIRNTNTIFTSFVIREICYFGTRVCHSSHLSYVSCRFACCIHTHTHHRRLTQTHSHPHAH